MTIKRPDVVYDDKKHSYHLDGVKLDGVSTVAKVGDDEVWGVASAWAFRIGYEGAYDLIDHEIGEMGALPFGTKDDLREALKQARKTPWHKTDDAKERGNAIHDALEHLAQKGEVPILDQYPESQRGYIQGLCRWYLDYRPGFVATEVQVVSEKHCFAGRYDMRADINPRRLSDLYPDRTAEVHCLIDLKTGKRVYPTTQFPQLAGYELASVEMGYPVTDAQFILNVHEDGTYDFERSNATAEHFLAYLAAHRATMDLKTKNKKGKR